MGKVIEKIKLKNLFNPKKQITIEAIVDTGATMLVMPKKVVEKLGLKKMRKVNVKYANGATEIKSIYGVVTAEIKGREGEFDVLAEPNVIQPLIGQIVLEQLDLIVEPSSKFDSYTALPIIGIM